jgi:cell division septation protein DedD
MKLKMIAVAVLCAFFTAGGAAWASSGIDRAEQFFMEGRYDAALYETDRLIASHYGQMGELYYLKGLCELKLNRFDEARGSFGYITSKYPGSPKAFDARLGTGDSYMLAGNLSSAVGIYVGMLDEFRSDMNLPVVYSRLASCYKTLGVKDKAEYYQNMASQSAPLSFEAKGQVVSAQTKAAAPKQSTPASNIVPRKSEEVDVVMATGRPISVQVGSFKNRRNAENLAKKLAASGYESHIEIPVSAGEKLYRVKAGKASSRPEAQALAARLNADGYATKICDGETCE